jgi:hypothetical protein
MIKQTEENTISQLRRELGAMQQASLAASKVGDYAKSAALAAKALGISKAIAREEGLPPMDFFSSEEPAYQ